MCMSAGAAYGQLGMGEDAAAAAYGKPMGSSTSPSTKIKTVHYRTETYTITAGFKDGKGVYFVYKKLSGASWTDPEIKSVLDGHRMGHNDWGWNKDIITGQSGPAVHEGGVAHISAVQQWHVFTHGDCSASYYPEKKLLLIWDASSGVDTGKIIDDDMM